MIARYVHTQVTTRRAMQSAVVRKGLKAKAKELSSRANRMGSSEGVSMQTRVEEGTRPLGRPYAWAISQNVGQEWGDRYTERSRILGRVAEDA